MAFVAEHRHAVERIVFEQPVVEPVPVFRHVDFSMVFCFYCHDAPDVRIFKQFSQIIHVAGFPVLMNEADESLR